MREIKEVIAEFCTENGIYISLSNDMPSGYETAYGTYDVTINTLFLNTAMLQDAPEYEVLFYLFHELRHAVQYLRPELFDTQIQESRSYVVLYNGICFKLEENAWREVTLEGPESYFTCAYMNLPYELEANAFAYEKVKEMYGDSPELRNLCNFWIPEDKWQYEQHKKLFRRIDAALIAKGKII